jgi:outer membrane protein TolC
VIRSPAPVLAAAIRVMLALSLAGCADAPGPRSSAVERLRPAGASPWREDLGDPVLRNLLERADQGALDVKVAVARLERADAEVQAAKAARSPVLTLGLDGAVGGRNRGDIRSAATPSLAATYEIDLFHRLDNATDAAKAERRATDADLRAARMLIGAETARAYCALRAAQLSRARAEQRQILAEKALGLTEIRRREGRSGIEDSAARRQAIAEAAGQRDAARLEELQQTNRLQALLGGPVVLPDAGLPAPRPLQPAPSDLTGRRPDVIAAYARLQAADAQRATAVAASRPVFEIGLSLGSVEPGVLNLLDARSVAWAAAASLSHDILDGGRDAARIRIASSDADLAELAYRRAAQQGWTEMRSAMAETAAADGALGRAMAAADRSRQLMAVAVARHREGLIDGVGLGSVENGQIQADESVDQARAKALSSRIALALASGG